MENKNRIAAAFLTLVFIICAMVLSVPAFAAEAADDKTRIVDGAGLLSDSEEAALSERLDEISERQKLDVVIVTVDSLEGEDVVAYADDFFDYNGYGFGEGKDGILFLISMEERDWCISTSGYGITAFTDAGQEYLSEKFLPYLSEGAYADAFGIFAEWCDDYITQARAGTPYDVDNIPVEPFSPLGALIIAVVLGFVVSFIVTGIMRLSLHSVFRESAADSYMKKDSLRLTKNYDLFLYKNVTRTEKPKETSTSTAGSSGGSTTHVSSSGNTHGGSKGKF